MFVILSLSIKKKKSLEIFISSCCNDELKVFFFTQNMMEEL